ncbi:MAG TPA: hypothetical protein VK061_08945 [Bacillota bacterium]|nr:hypothetical protein [Bacillota bacterium]
MNKKIGSTEKNRKHLLIPSIIAINTYLAMIAFRALFQIQPILTMDIEIVSTAIFAGVFTMVGAWIDEISPKKPTSDESKSLGQWFNDTIIHGTTFQCLLFVVYALGFISVGIILLFVIP